MTGTFRGARGYGRLTLGFLTAGFFLAFLITLPPHLVHHLFEEDHGRPACPHLAHGQQTPAVEPELFTPAPPGPTEPAQALLPRVFLPLLDLAVSPSRAPPRFAPSA
jgi:hypothetical protein